MVVVKQNNLQFVRRFVVDIQSLRNNDCDELASEVQKSISYCQKEFYQEAPTKFLVPPESDFKNVIKNMTKQMGMGKEAVIFGLGEIANFKKPVTSQMESNCWIAVGGALRNILSRT